ncbi:MAG: hypothetical protein LBL49_03355 [Clostridiales Family XIII bacterium]|jgi:hypothetical protein|nr:hypothetical protein [Clostridiales Family XIII bacterium]
MDTLAIEHSVRRTRQFDERIDFKITEIPMNLRLNGTMKKRLAALICAAVAGAYITAGAFIITHIDHDCVGEGCEVCLQIQDVKLLLANSTFAALTVFTAVRLAITSAVNRPHFVFDAAATPVAAKVRLNY